MDNSREVEICAHCQLNAMTLRACGKLIGADGVQHAIAFFDTAQAEGLTLEQMCDLLRAIDKAPRQQVDNSLSGALAHATTPHFYRH